MNRLSTAPTQRSAKAHSRGQDSEFLVKLVASGDEVAFASLHERTCGLIFGMLLHILGNSASAEEFLVEVYREVRKQSAFYDDKREGLLTWLITIVCRCAAQLEASRRKHQMVRGTSTDKPEWRSLVCSTLEALSPAQRQMIELEYFFGLNHNDIATRLDLPLGLVQTEIHDALLKLRELGQLLSLSGVPLPWK